MNISNSHVAQGMMNAPVFTAPPWEGGPVSRRLLLLGSCEVSLSYHNLGVPTKGSIRFRVSLFLRDLV